MIRSALLVGACLLGGPGCGSEESGPSLPETYAVTGTLVEPDGSPVKEGTLTLKSESDPSLTVTGAIDPGGTFELVTIMASERESGAPAGRYEVTFVRPLDGGQGAEVVPLEPVTLEAKETELSLRVPPKGSKR